jgi:hypothetical protein
MLKIGKVVQTIDKVRRNRKNRQREIPLKIEASTQNTSTFNTDLLYRVYPPGCLKRPGEGRHQIHFKPNAVSLITKYGTSLQDICPQCDERGKCQM